MLLTNEQFKLAIRAYLKENNIGQRELAEKMVIPRGTLTYWLNPGVSNETRRTSIISAYPWLFGAANNHPEGQPSLSPATQESEKGNSNISKEIRAAIKTEVARHFVLPLSEILNWFLFNATAAERDQFREEIGDSWKSFLELTRAMTGEQAFKIAVQEGRIKCRQ